MQKAVSTQHSLNGRMLEVKVATPKVYYDGVRVCSFELIDFVVEVEISIFFLNFLLILPF